MRYGRSTLRTAAAGGTGWQWRTSSGGSGAWAGTRGGLKKFRSGMRSGVGAAVHGLGLLLSMSATIALS
jgi:hypothetical protein